MHRMTFDCEDGKRHGADSQQGRIIVDFQREHAEDGKRLIGFSLERVGPGHYERMCRFTPEDVPRLVCVLQAIAGYLAICDELDPVQAGRMQALFVLLHDYMDYSNRRFEREKRWPSLKVVSPLHKQ